MPDDPYDDPGWREYAKRAREVLEPMVRDSVVGVSIVNGTVDPKLAIETGYMILLDKPIIVAVTPGTKVPNKLALVADEIIELDLNDPSFPLRLQEAVSRVIEL